MESGRLFLINVLVFLALAGAMELGARAVEWGVLPAGRSAFRAAEVVAHPVLHHAFRAGDQGVDPSRAIPYAYRINSQGWREESDIPVEKPPHEFRIFFVGDSNTQGVVKDSAGVVRRVEASLNERFRGTGWRIRAINTGTSSYSFLQYYLLIHRILPRYSPDLLIVNADFTDLANDFFYRQFVETDAEGAPVAIVPNHSARQRYRLSPFESSDRKDTNTLWTEALRLSAAVRLISRWAAPGDWGLPAMQKGDSPARWHEDRWTPQTEAAVEYSLGMLRRLVESATRRKVPIVVTLVPHHPQFTGHWSSRAHALLEKRVTGYGALFLNSFRELRGRVSGSPPEQYYWRADPTHFNEQGYGIWATAMTQFLLRNEKRVFGRSACMLGLCRRLQ